MVTGFLAGFAAASLQAASYLCSRGFMHRHASALLLLIYSQLVMGIIGLVSLPFLSIGRLFEEPSTFIWMLIGWLLAISAGQVTFFQALREIEASRLSSLLGLKIVVLAVIFVLFLGGRLNGGQLLAILLSAVAAMAMNWSGPARFSWRGILWLAAALITYSLADIAETHLVQMVRGLNMVSDGLAICAVCYGSLGLLTLPALKFCPRNRRMLLDAIPFAFTWYYAMAALFVCFGELGTVFGNVIQASRGILSVLFGAALAAAGFSALEQAAPRKDWIRRLAAALLMAAAIVLYSLCSAQQ